MIDKIHNITKWILLLLMALAVIAGGLFYLGYLTEDILINFGIALIIAAAAVTVLGALFNMAENPKSAIMMLFSLILFVVVFGIAYSIAGNQLSALQLEQYDITSTTSKLVGMGLYATYISFGIAILVILYSSVVKAFK